MNRFLALILTAGAALVSTWLPSEVSAQGLVLMPDSTNNRLVAFDPVNGSVVNPNMFMLAAGTPIHAMQVGSEIWVSEQIGDRISRWDFSGAFLGQIGGGAGGGLDNVRGMALVGNTVYLANAGTGNGAPGASVVMFSTAGALLGNFSTAGLSTGPFGIFDFQGGLLVSSDAANDDIHRFTLTGTSLGTFHNSTSLNFVEQLTLSSNGSVLAAGFSSNNVATLDPNNGAILGSFTASGARGVYQLGNGNILWTSGAGAFVFDVVAGTSSQVYTGGGRFLQFANIPEPSSLVAFGTGAILLGLVRRRARR